MPFSTMHCASKAVKDNSLIYFEKGVYRKGLKIVSNSAHIIGEKGVVFDGAVVNGKATLVLSGNDIVVENIECRNIFC